jgi:hypothetical protein
MKFLDFVSLLGSEPARIALLSTYQFDPVFFERRVLTSPALSGARRIVVFVDARHWSELLQDDIPARFLNRRYLVIPVHRSAGVFHPKLNLLTGDDGTQVICGSNNLTRSGCASNLELLNSVRFARETAERFELDLARESVEFFSRLLDEADPEISRIATEWLAELRAESPWLTRNDEGERGPIRLIHTYGQETIWKQLVEHLSTKRPTKFLVISPFHDSSGEMTRRLRKQWPRARIEILVQQSYTNLPVKAVSKIKGLSLSELRGSSRRLHAKLLAWEGRGLSGALVGSANFTTAAMDGRNVEACFLIEKGKEEIDGLFDGRFRRQEIAADRFEPGHSEPPGDEDYQLPTLSLVTAVLRDSGHLHVEYRHTPSLKPQLLHVEIRSPGEVRPRASFNVKNARSGTALLKIPDSVLRDLRGTLLANLVAEFEKRETEKSPPVWVVMESYLTYEQGSGPLSSVAKIEASGEGLTEYLDQVGQAGGIDAVIEHLRRLTIRFAGGSGARKSGSRQLRSRDPYRDDSAPEWLTQTATIPKDLSGAIYDFADRHFKKCLRKHASIGNINGIENFTNVLRAIVHLLYVYHKHGVVPPGRLISKLCDYVLVSSKGKDTEKESWPGFIEMAYNVFKGDVVPFQEAFAETHFVSEVWAILLVAQKARYELDLAESSPSSREFSRSSRLRSVRDALPTWVSAITESVFECELIVPEEDEVRMVLEDYGCFTTKEVSGFLKGFPR